MARVLSKLFSRFGAAKGVDPARQEKHDSGAVPAAGRMPARLTVPVNVCDYDGDDEPVDEMPLGGPRGAAVRNFHCEADATVDEPSRSAPFFSISAAGATHRGMRRSSNEDAFLVLAEQGVYVVADGMGGHAGGEIASQLAVEAIAAAFHDDIATSLHDHVPPLAAELVQSIGAANEAIHAAASKNRQLSDMGTTVVAARFDANKGRLYVGHVGDSRCYRLREGVLKQITRDHTMAELGLTGREGGYLSRAVGRKIVVEADVAVVEPRPGDVYLLCTDGLTKMIPDAVVGGTLAEEKDPVAAAAALISRANAAGGRDNITALVVRITSAPITGDAAVA